MSGSLAGICWRLGLDEENLPVTVPPPSFRSWWNSQCILPLCWCRSMVSIKVLLALSTSRSLTIICATGCAWEFRYCLVKEGAPASVLGYFRSIESNTLATDAAAHGSILTPVWRCISNRNSLSLVFKTFLACSALSRSTRTPSWRMSHIMGTKLVSKPQMFQRSCLSNSTFKRSHKRRVNPASCSAYLPTNSGGNLYISAFGSNPHSAAATRRSFSSFLSSK